MQKNKKEQELNLENKGNDLEEKKKWAQPCLPLFPSTLALHREPRDSSGWTAESSDPDRVRGPTADQLHV